MDITILRSTKTRFFLILLTAALTLEVYNSYLLSRLSVVFCALLSLTFFTGIKESLALCLFSSFALQLFRGELNLWAVLYFLIPFLFKVVSEILSFGENEHIIIMFLALFFGQWYMVFLGVNFTFWSAVAQYLLNGLFLICYHCVARELLSYDYR